MTQFAPGNVQSASNPLAKRGRCCCCCNLRSGIIILGILLILKGALLAYQWCYFSDYITDYSYYHDSDDSSMVFDDNNNDFGNDHDNNDYTNDNDKDLDMGMTDVAQDQQGQDQDQQQGQQGQQQDSGHGGDVRPVGDGDDEEEQVIYDDDIETFDEEEEIEIPTWVNVVAWLCVAWHILGGIWGTFAGCSYKKCCAFMFWLWWVISTTVGFACGVLVLYYYGVCYFLLGAFIFAMIICIYFTVKAKKWYNLLRDQARQPAGYNGIQLQNV